MAEKHEETAALTQTTSDGYRTYAVRMAEVEHTFLTPVCMCVCVLVCLWSFFQLGSPLDLTSAVTGASLACRFDRVCCVYVSTWIVRTKSDKQVAGERAERARKSLSVVFPPEWKCSKRCKVSMRCLLDII